MLEPRPQRQAFIERELALALDEHAIHRSRGRRIRLLGLRERTLVALGSARERVEPVIERRKVHVRRHGLAFRRDARVARIADGFEHAFLELAIALTDLRALVVGQLLDLADVLLHRVG